jgi:hypothetical protein
VPGVVSMLARGTHTLSRGFHRAGSPNGERNRQTQGNCGDRTVFGHLSFSFAYVVCDKKPLCG